tara:strand:- start:425 stop:1126 length:702 start_codon:yes stop_codon:yes gene_type:complete
MRYKLERSTKGMITQRENGDGGNIYSQREELNKIALDNLKKNSPSGKLGKLSDLQIFNFSVSFTATGSVVVIREEFNTTATGSTACNDAVMFTNGKSGDGLYYNILDIKCDVFTEGSLNQIDVLEDSYVQFYLLQNSASPIGKKIPRSQTLFSSASGGSAVAFTTTGAKEENQYTSVNLTSDSVNIPSLLTGLRCSGLALKTIYLNLDLSEPTEDIILNFVVYVDNSSVSRSF